MATGLFPSQRGSRNRKKPLEGGLILTSLLDVFVLLVFFLLKSYSAEGTILTLPADLALPVSTSLTTPKVAVQVMLTESSLQVDGVTLPVDPREVEASNEMLIPPLLDHLKVLAAQYQAIAEQNQTVTFTGDLILAGDRNIPFRLLKKILYTAGQAGFINQSLAVYQKGD
jgi:biopolymer transport protein ExbD